MMSGLALEDLRRRSVHLRALADIRLVAVAEGCGAGGRLVEVRTPCGLSCDVALDRGGDILRLNWKGVEIGWHSAAGGVAPWPSPDAEDGLGFLRGFDGFLVTCGLDHHGVATKTDAASFNYPLRQLNHHPLHGRVSGQRAELVEKRVDWDAGVVRLRLLVRQATVFGEVLELDRTIRIALYEGRIALEDSVLNRGFSPTRHGLLYHVNIGHPVLGPAARLTGSDWTLRDRLDAGDASPVDGHAEMVDVHASPPEGEIGIVNSDCGVALRLTFDPKTLPATGLWRAYQSGVFALGLEPQTVFSDVAAGSRLDGGQERVYGLTVHVGNG